MRIQIVAVGKGMPEWVVKACAHYARRLPSELRVTLREVAMPKRPKRKCSDSERALVMAKEGKNLLAEVSASERVVLLDERGHSWSSKQVAQRVQVWQEDARDVSLFIGGPDGFSDTCRQRAQEHWSLSALTLPHPMVRVVVMEQLYRAWSILKGHPYHRE